MAAKNLFPKNTARPKKEKTRTITLRVSTFERLMKGAAWAETIDARIVRLLDAESHLTK